MKGKPMRKPLFFTVLSIIILAGCDFSGLLYEGPTSQDTVTVSWALSSQERMIMPNFASPVTYTVRLSPSKGETEEKKGATSSSTTFKIKADKFTVSVVGYDQDNRPIVSGSAILDSTKGTKQVHVPLNYILSGTGTGQLQVSINSIYEYTTAELRLITPDGEQISPDIPENATQFTYINEQAITGDYQVLIIVKTATHTALKFDTLLVAQNTPTIMDIHFLEADFFSTYVPVASLQLADLQDIGMGASVALQAYLGPEGASNPLILWSSDNPEIAEISNTGVITGKAPGQTTIRAVSAENTEASDEITVTVRYMHIQYDGNGAESGELPLDTSSYSTGQTATVMGNPGNLENPGFILVGWSTEQSYGATYYSFGDTFEFGNTDRILYAVWAEGTSVSFNENLGSGMPPSPQYYLDGDLVTVPDNPTDLTRANFVLIGWSSSTNWTNGEVYAPGDTFTMGSEPVTLYAMWNNVRYDGNGHTSGAVPVETNLYGAGSVSVTVRDNTGNLAKEGYRFMGWNPNPDGTGTSYNAAAVFTKPAGALVLYARWQPVYTISYDSNGAASGQGPVDSSSYLATENATLLGNTGGMDKPDHLFTGWNTEQDGSGNQYAVGAQITTGDNDVTLYARWTPQVATASSSGYHMLIHTTTGKLYAAGYNHFDIDNGEYTYSQKPVLVTNGIPNNIKHVLARSNSGKGLGYSIMPYSLLITEDGVLWGTQGTGLAGVISPQAVVNNIEWVSPSNGYILVVRTGGELQAVGANRNYSWGVGTSPTSTTSYTPIIPSGVERVWTDGDYQTTTGTTYYYSTFIRKTDGTLWAAGHGGNVRKLGIDVFSTNTFMEVPGMGGGVVADVAIGTNHCLILKTDGTVWAAGQNSSGQFGSGTTTTENQTTFTKIENLGNTVKAVYAFDGTSFFLKNDGSLYYSGGNAGNASGNTSASNTPQPQLLLSDVVHVDIFKAKDQVIYPGCVAVKSDGSVWIWGNANANFGLTGVNPQQLVF